jgi:hypothetical protein
MADELDDLLAARATADDAAVDDIDAALAGAAGEPAPTPAPAKPQQKWYDRAATGFMDPVVGAGQLLQHALPDSVANFIRSPQADALRGVFPQIGAAKLLLGIAAGKPTATTEEIDARVAGRERDYQEERKAAGSEGLDWWRIGGSLTNPMTWMSPAGKGSTVLAGIKSGAQAGAFQALMQPVTSEGNFLWDKGMQTVIGAGVGGALGGALKMLSPAFSYATRTIRSALGTNADDTIAQAASQRVTNETLQAAGVDPTKVDPNLYSAIQREVGDALKAGVDPDPMIMARRADAAALPVPVHLSRGQAARDPMQFAWEHRVAGQQGVGEPLSDLLAAQNRALIANLNELGAAAAPDPFTASQQVIKHIEGVDDALRARINAAYGAVRDSAGRPARVNNQGFLDAAKNRLTGGKPELAEFTGLADYLPEAVRKQYNDIATGKLPLTVDSIQFLDRAWGGVQRGAADDTQRNAIGALRAALNEAPVDDALGQQSMQAYKAARELAKQRFDLIDSNPAYKAIVEGTKLAEPDRFFQSFVQGADVSKVRTLKELIGPDNTAMLQNTMVGQLKRAALNRASDEGGVFSQAAYNKMLQDPVQAPRIRELFAGNPTVLDQLYRVGRVSENLIKIPAASKVNTSNTASAGANIVRDVARSETGQALSSMLPNWLTGLGRTMTDAGRRVEEAQAVQAAVSPGVTVTQLPRPSQPGQARLSDLLARGGAAAYATDDREKPRK